jgi:serine/threonine protein kinase
LEKVIANCREQNNQLDQGRVKKWSIEVLEGLEYLHTRETVHFDIKPSSLLLDELERVKIGSLDLASNKNIIDTGFKGKPCYVSPQVVRGENIDEKTDIWYNYLGVCSFYY